MANSYYDSQLTAEQIETVLEAISLVISPSNNGKVLSIENGSISAKSVSEFGGATLISKNITENGTYHASSDNADGYASVNVNVSGGGGSSGPLEYFAPINDNLGNGYVSNGTWIYDAAYPNLKTVVFYVQSGEKYLFIASESIERFRAMFPSSSPIGATENIVGTSIIDESSPSPYEAVSFAANQNGYVSIYVGGQSFNAYGFKGELKANGQSSGRSIVP